ncbi:hypothetical protein [Kitasatospora sp. NPDC004272]
MDRPLTSAELNAMFDATDNAALAREEAELRREERATKCPGVGEYGHGLTGRIVHWGCCGDGPAIS